MGARVQTSVLARGRECPCPHVHGEQGVPVLKSLNSLGGTHAPLAVPIKCSRCSCPHRHFESGGCSSPLGAGAAPCPRSPRSSRPRWCQRGADNAASVAHQRRGLPAAGTATGPPQMKAPAPRAPTSAAGARCASAPGGAGPSGGSTAPRHTGDRSPSRSRCPRTDPPTCDTWGSNLSADRYWHPRGYLRPEWCSPPAAPCPSLPVPVPTPLT